MSTPTWRPAMIRQTSHHAPLEPSDLMVYLRHHGITVYDVTRARRAPIATYTTFVVYLEGNLAEFDSAQDHLHELPGVLGVAFSDESKAIMFVRAEPSPPPENGPADQPGGPVPRPSNKASE